MSEIQLGHVIRTTDKAYLVKIDRKGRQPVEAWVPKSMASITKEGVPVRTMVWVPPSWAAEEGLA